MTASDTTTRRRTRGVAAWLAIAIGLLGVGAIGAVLATAGEWAERGSLDPGSAGPDGTRALVEILRDRGVEVIVTGDRLGAEEALAASPATLVLPDTPALSDDAVMQLTDAAADVVLIAPRARTLDLLLPGSVPAGIGPIDPVAADCDLPAAVRAGDVAPGALYAAGDAVTACYPAGDGHGLLSGPHGSAGTGSVSAVDGTALFTNDLLADDGNAALALNLMGAHPRLVWYVPSLGDTDLTGSDRSLGELTPPWVSPVIVLLLAAAGAAAIWRGRRFGPLVAERLPVTVRASETTEGRARLYARSRDAVHAADQLRLAALGRLARALSLGTAASAPDVADAAAAVTGLDRTAVRAALIDDVPATDGDLLDLHDRIRHIEDAVHAAIRPEGRR